ncbi:hypothetical protein FQR65_LT06992 [Abscondita terminalis]|nr:hypothetical protein FQR65_LT06992 [Abscondita terminalis]
MAKLKNITFCENDLYKKEKSEGPQEMVDIDLKNFQTGSTNPLQITNNSTFKLNKNYLTADKQNENKNYSLCDLIRKKKDVSDGKIASSPDVSYDDIAEKRSISKFKNNLNINDSLNHHKSNLKEEDNTNKNVASPMCPTYNSPFGYPILQQQVSPYTFNLQYGYPQPEFKYSHAPSYYSQSTSNKRLTFNGQNYICHPVIAFEESSIKNVSDATETGDAILQQPLLPNKSESRTRASRTCPIGEISCGDNSKCIKDHQRCDGEVHCKDVSDEADCPCKERLSKSRICDGYVDCPKGEDELRCFGCKSGTFSCDDWSIRERVSTCIPIEERCDGIPQCPSEKDELDCSILIDNFLINEHPISSKSIGFLYKNVKGRWYPACHNVKWAIDACRAETGPNTIAPIVNFVSAPLNYNGFYAREAELNIEIVESCSTAYVECPPLVCGIRIKEHNPFRRDEVDTSAEQILGATINEKNLTDSNDPILGSGRVVGGKPSQPKAWPWIVSVYRNGVFHCGGALINEYWIVSAAHCVDKYWHYYYEIQAGVLRRYSYSPMVQNREVSNIVAHQFYDKVKLKNDISLMKISKPLEFNRYVRPICLPSEITAGKNFLWGPEPGTLCTAVGWGAMAEHGVDPDHLREVQVPVHKKCKHQEDEEGREICAGLREGGKDACQGDSGGPFMCRNPNVPNQWYLAGVVSHGEGCARPNEPGVYTRVSLFLGWIFEHIHSELLPPRKPLHRCPGYICKDNNVCIANKRRCDKTVDCLLGDDEIDCERNTFTEIFKHAMRNMFLRNEGLNDHPKVNVNQTKITEEKQNETSTTSTILTNVSKLDLPITVPLWDGGISNTTEKTIATTLPMKLNSPSSSLPSNSLKRQKVSDKFVCKKMLQTIAINKMCDRRADCEDASDEQDCTCMDFLRYSFPDTICDGETDCSDGSDENNCSICAINEYHCRRSNMCIELSRRCDNIPDCPLHEDEADCFALTDGKTLKVDEDFRPYINKSGVVTINQNGTWRVFCSNWTGNKADVAADICFFLGFSDYVNFFVGHFNNSPLKLEYNYSLLEQTITTNNTRIENCVGLFVKCSTRIDVKHHFHENHVTNILKVETPWNAKIYAEGVFMCTGTLMEPDWVLTAGECFGHNPALHREYVSVLLGSSKSYLNVVSPHEQILRVVDVLQVNSTNLFLLRLDKKSIFTRYVRPIGFDVEYDAVGRSTTCFAQGGGPENSTNFVYLQPIRNCPIGRRCFKRKVEFLGDCNNRSDVIKSWTGSIVCRSLYGWYSAAVYSESLGECGFQQNLSYTSVSFWKATILKLLYQNPFKVDPPKCEGVRCDLGDCISLSKVCDGVIHCRNGADELNCPNNCDSKINCSCLKSEMKCANGKCVPKFKFCDKFNDCGDWSDEPDLCSCSNYLRLTHPERVCDGIRHCHDRSDEDPNICNCTANSFICAKSHKCVSQDVVCDGVRDCPDGEDENECLLLRAFPNSEITEVYVRSAGVWHSGCFPNHLTTLELEEICSSIGYNGRSAKILNPSQNFSRQSKQIVTDVFAGIWIRPKTSKLLIAMRDGTEQFVQFKDDPTCFRLFLHCL